MKRSRNTHSPVRHAQVGYERLETRRALDASTLSTWSQTTDASVQSLTLDQGGTAVANAQSGDFTYTVSNGAVTISGYTGAGGAIQIPATIASLPVTAVGNNAFSGESTLTSVTVPLSVTSIGEWAFFNCAKLASVNIPSNVTSIGRYAFQSCPSLTTAAIPSSVASIGLGAFGYCAKLPAITVDAANTVYASLDGMLFNKSLTTLLQCPGGKTGAVSISSIVTSIGSEVLFPCTLVTSFNVDAANPNYASVGGLLFNKSLTTLIQCPGGKSGAINVLGGVTRIGDLAFRSCGSITSVFVPSSVTSMGYSPFYQCTRLTAFSVDAANTNYVSVQGVLFNKALTTVVQYPGGRSGSFTVPSSVTNVMAGAFRNCPNLTHLYFEGAPPTSLGVDSFTAGPDIIYRTTAASGWSNTFGGVPVVVYQPVDVPVGQIVEATIAADVARVMKQGAGTAAIGTASTRTGGTVVASGELVVRNKDAFGVGLLEVQAGAKATLQTGYDTVSVTSLSLASTARLELGTSKMTVAAGGFTESSIRTKLIAGRNGGSWDGASGITSTFAGGDRAIGYRVADGALEMAFAAPGDSNLDGVIDILDLSEILSAGKFNTGGTANWMQGDTNYDGVFDILDISEIVGNGLFNKGSYLTQPAASSAATDAGTVATFDPAMVFAAFAMDSGGQTTTKRKSF